MVVPETYTFVYDNNVRSIVFDIYNLSIGTSLQRFKSGPTLEDVCMVLFEDVLRRVSLLPIFHLCTTGAVQESTGIEERDILR